VRTAAQASFNPSIYAKFSRVILDTRRLEMEKIQTTGKGA